MAKKLFNAVANILANRRLLETWGKGRDAVDAVASDMADMFADENPRFDRERFLAACREGSEPETRKEV